MTTTKPDAATTAKTEKTTAQTPSDVQTAYEIHTLAHMIYGHLCTTHPWMTPFPTSTAFSPPAAWPPTPTGESMPAWNVHVPLVW